MATKALLAPVPYPQLASAEEVCRREGKVAFPTSTWELSRDLQGGMPVLFYASRSGVLEGNGPEPEEQWRHPYVTWLGSFVRYVPAVGGRHPEAPFQATVVAERQQQDILGFYEVAGLEQLPRERWIAIEQLRDQDGRRYPQAFIPERPVLVFWDRPIEDAATPLPAGRPEPTDDVELSWSSLTQHLAAGISKMQRDQYLILSIAPPPEGAERPWYYVQFACGGEEGFRVEAVSNRFLADRWRLSEKAAEILFRLGWHAPDSDAEPKEGKVNYWTNWPAPPNAAAMAQLAVSTLRRVYGITSPNQLEYKYFQKGGQQLELADLGLRREAATRAEDGTVEHLRPIVERTLREVLHVGELKYDKQGNIPIRLRLKRELVGYPDNRPGAVRLPPMGKQWHEFTREDLNGDFQPGFANHAALQGSQPVLLVVKKNGPVLRRLLRWLDDAPVEVRRTLPMLLVDDEADQASIDVRGTYQTEDGPPDPDYESPSVINGLIRELLGRFDRSAYVAYTATPFANILIPHDTADPSRRSDLYPKDFIIDLPKPVGYFGAQEFFGRMDGTSGEALSGLDVIRGVADQDIVSLQQGAIPQSLEMALLDFVLGGAARAARALVDFAATMLVHTSQLVVVQGQLRQLVDERLSELRDAWRYHRTHGIRDRLRERWELDFRGVTRTCHIELDVAFEAIEPHIGPFFEAVQVREINSVTGEVLDYERQPTLKAIAIGGNRLSRGLTLEGLLTSYFVRRSVSYDTLMQMGRWFGFRGGYEDLTRIYTTAELAGWFADLAYVEYQLREDIQVYENEGLSPSEMGMRIWQHPTMQVTSPLKRRFASSTTISQSYSNALQQTFKFPLRRLEDLAAEAEASRLAVLDFVQSLTACSHQRDEKGPIWTQVPVELVLNFLRNYHADARVGGISLPLICAYVERMRDTGELTNWTVAVRGRDARDARLGDADWGLPGGPVFQISRSRLAETESLGVITSPGDELCGLSPELRQGAQGLVEAAQAAGKTKSVNSAARELRPPTDGLLLLYPISRFSGSDLGEGGARRPLFEDPNGPLARDLVGLAVSFPKSNQPQRVEAYLEGTVGWRPAG